MVVSGRRHRIMRMREGCVGCNPVEQQQQQDGRWWATLNRSCMFVPFARWWFSVLVGLLGWGELRGGGLWGGGWGGGGGGHKREKRGLKVVVLLVGVWCRSLAGSAATKGAEARGERKGWWFPGLFGGDGGRGEERGGEGAGHILTKGPRHRSRGKQTRSSRSGPRSCQSASSASSSCPNNRAQGPRPGGDEAVPEASQMRAATSPRISPSFFRPYPVHRTNLVPCFTPAAGIADSGWEERTKVVDEHVDVVGGGGLGDKFVFILLAVGTYPVQQPPPDSTIWPRSFGMGIPSPVGIGGSRGVEGEGVWKVK